MESSNTAVPIKCLREWDCFVYCNALCERGKSAGGYVSFTFQSSDGPERQLHRDTLVVPIYH